MGHNYQENNLSYNNSFREECHMKGRLQNYKIMGTRRQQGATCESASSVPAAIQCVNLSPCCSIFFIYI